MSNFQKIIGVSLLIISLSIAYYFVIFIPQRENAKIQLQKQEQLKKELKEKEVMQTKEEAKQALNSCLSQADINGNNFWNRECEGQGLLSQSCIDFLAKGTDIYYDKTMTADEIKKKLVECSCRLPQYNADRVSQSVKDDKAECFKKYPQN